MSLETTDLEALTLHTGNRSVGILISAVSEIIEPVPVVSVPLTHPFFSGFISLRNQILPLIRLSEVLQAGSNASLIKEDRKFVICSAESGSVALDIDAVGDTYVFQSGQIAADGDVSQFFNSEVQLQDGELPLLDIKELIDFIQTQNTRIRNEAGLAQND
ncbi:chemotaxis protein CheW [Sporolactobacillus pectinivorans]|uniref:chemotaxis protein CheW n=1 Tax=Sporolactobacillus pectinivorans TaxID=1591408 RepID=UPI000C25C669|nr:chemotaxis protein CheW [Sporolactobacillus pectinivorans]